MNKEKLFEITLKLASNSLSDGNFPAGAVVVTPDDSIFESDSSLGWNHAEMSAIDNAIKVVGTKNFPPLNNSTLYALLEPCLMCRTKMYWAGIKTVYYILPKESVDLHLCYAGNFNLTKLSQKYFQEIQFTQIKSTDIEAKALKLYKEWEKRVTG